ncbi:MAG: hypothetical protein IJU52_00390 [Clostridia bacterium]|nr:hypothetical protein [Clostridia bacterium]
MRKTLLSYILWKAAADLLYLVMLLGATAPLGFILNRANLGDAAATRITSGASFVFFLLLYYYFLKRADLSGTGKKKFFIGEIAAYALVCAVGTLLLFAVSGSVTPADFSYVSYVFLPTYGGAYLTGNIFAGAPVTVAAFALCLPLLFLLKRTKDPALTGRKNAGRRAIEGEAVEAAAQDGENGAASETNDALPYEAASSEQTKKDQNGDA